MRRILYFFSLLSIVGLAVGCQHVGGMCDCPGDNPYNCGAQAHFAGAHGTITPMPDAEKGNADELPKGKSIPLDPPKKLPKAPGAAPLEF